jgi:hypothetical protein
VGPELFFRCTAVDVFPATSEVLFEVARITDVSENGWPVDGINEISRKGF